MGNNFRHGGATGDIIFSLPTIKALGGGHLFIHPYDRQRAESIAKLIRLQDYIASVTITQITYDCHDLDLFRNYAGHFNNLIDCHAMPFGIQVSKDAWLKVENNAIIDHSFSLIATGSNYLDASFDWNKEVDYLLTFSEVVYFLGYQDEYDRMQAQWNTKAVFWDCDFLCAAEMIMAAEMYTGGYTGLTTIAQGLGKPYRLVQAPGHTCSTLFVERETIVNV